MHSVITPRVLHSKWFYMAQLKLFLPWINIWRSTIHRTGFVKQLLSSACSQLGSVYLHFFGAVTSILTSHLFVLLSVQHWDAQPCNVVFYTTHSCFSVLWRNGFCSGNVQQFILLRGNYASCRRKSKMERRNKNMLPHRQPNSCHLVGREEWRRNTRRAASCGRGGALATLSPS
jgi:hypothetical protein